VNASILGFHNAKIKRTLKEAGVPSEEVLIADGIDRLQPQQIDQLKGEIAEIRALLQSDSIKNLFSLASANYYSGQYEEAKTVYDRILDTKPDDPIALHNRGITFCKLEEYQESLSDFNRTLELRPDDPDTPYNAACLYSLWEKPDDSVAYLGRLLKEMKNTLEWPRKMRILIISEKTHVLRS
jgi:tetratricopeptide (TPR) repeat protein